jgi:hypothetical protein
LYAHKRPFCSARGTSERVLVVGDALMVEAERSDSEPLESTGKTTGGTALRASLAVQRTVGRWGTVERRALGERQRAVASIAR